MENQIQKAIELFSKKSGYILHNQELATVITLAESLDKPLLLEGEPGVGKTAIAGALACAYDRHLIRLQCYEGLDANMALYEWNYAKQLLQIRINESTVASKLNKEARADVNIFTEDYLIKRPLLQALQYPKKSVLLIDEIDRADEEFEAFLLELLSEFQISIPELGTIHANVKPAVILTSNRTRELSDALKRRCLYHWLDYPSLEMEIKIVKNANPDLEEQMIKELVSILHRLRKYDLEKRPGIAEAIDWAATLLQMQCKKITKEFLQNTAGVLLKSRDDFVILQQFLKEDDSLLKVSRA